MAQQSLLFRLPVHHVEGGDVGIGGWTRRGFACLTFVGVVQGPHTSPNIMVEATIILFALKGFYELVAFFAICIFGGLVLPCPLLVRLFLLFLLLFLYFLRFSFLVRLCLARCCLLFHRFVSGGAATHLLERIDLRHHRHDLF